MTGLPFVIGIAGHRHFPGPEQPIADAIRAQLAHWLRRAGRTPVVMLSSLADGVDQIAAEAAVTVGIRLVVILPKPRVAVRAEVDNKDRYDRLLAAAQRVSEVPVGNQHPYAAAAAEIARRSHLLIAVWDGSDADAPKPGGTAYSVLLRRGQWPTGSVAWRSERTGPCRVMRLDAESINTERDDAARHAEAATKDALRSLSALNRELTRRHGTTPDSSSSADIQHEFGTAARRLRDAARRFRRILIVAALAAFGLQQAGDYAHNNTLALTGIGLLIAMFVIGWAFRRQDRHQRHLGLRTAAELLRIYTAVPDAASSGESHLRLAQFRAMHWMMRAVLEVHASAVGARVPVGDWVNGQCRYFGNAAKHAARRSRWLGWGSRVFYVVAIVATLAAAIIVGVDGGLRALAAVLLILTTAVEQYAYWGAYAEDAARYGELHHVFRIASMTFPADPDRQTELGRELAGESLAELGFWYATHVTRAPHALKT